MSGSSILYVTVDGVLQPLAYSQVCRVLFGLTKRGFRYQLLSLESKADLADQARVNRLRSELADNGVKWTHHPYDQSGTAKAAATNLVQLGRRMHALVRDGSTSLVHARSYHSSLVARAMQRVSGVPYIFDARGRWIDERLLGRRWFTNPWVERGARRVERELYQHACGLVTLTQLHADDIVSGDFGPYSGAPIRVITTCADFDSFTLEPRLARGAGPSPAIPGDIEQQLAGKLVLGFVGSSNAFYRHQESFRLAAAVLARRPDAHLLVITAQQREFRDLAAQAGLPATRVAIVSAPHRDMPEWLARIDWSIQLLNAGIAKRGSMPTKLAEFFASGVRPVHFGCNSEVTEWVERAGSGYVLKSLEAEEIDAAAAFVANSEPAPELLASARARVRAHFDLAAGLESYASLLLALGHRPDVQAA